VKSKHDRGRGDRLNLIPRLDARCAEQSQSPRSVFRIAPNEANDPAADETNPIAEA
jgi:hypothetical protein